MASRDEMEMGGREVVERKVVPVEEDKEVQETFAQGVVDAQLGFGRQP